MFVGQPYPFFIVYGSIFRQPFSGDTAALAKLVERSFEISEWAASNEKDGTNDKVLRENFYISVLKVLLSQPM